MNTGSRTILLFISSTAMLIVVLAIVLMQLVNREDYRRQIEVGLSEAIGTQVSIAGPIRFVWFPELQVSLKDLSIRNGSLEIASVGEAIVGLRYFPLLRGFVSIDTVWMDDVSIFIEHSQSHLFRFHDGQYDDRRSASLNLTSVSLSNTTLHFDGPMPWQAFQATDCSIEARNLSRSNPDNQDFIRDIVLSSDIRCNEVTTGLLLLSEVEVTANAKGGIVTFEPIRLHLLDANATGSAIADFSGDIPQFNLQFSLPHFPIEAFFRILSDQQVVAGPADFSTELSLQGSDFDEMTHTMTGMVSLQGDNLTLDDIDLDKELSRLQSSQNFNLVDVGAFFLLGPVGLAVTRGYQFANLLQGSGGTSDIHTLVSDWQIEGGIMRAQDVAMTTDHNRIALQGALDFVNREFDAIIVAVVDPKGCIMVQQQVKGTFVDPVIEAPNVIESIARPALELLKQGQDLLDSADCEVFYSGSVVTST